MILYINTIKKDSTEIEVGLMDVKGNWLVKKKVKAQYRQAEKLLPLVEKMFDDKKLAGKMRKGKKLRLKDVKEVNVVNRGGSFTSLRIGVVTANALGYALGIPVKGLSSMDEMRDKMKPGKIMDGKGQTNAKKKKIHIVPALYDREPNITLKK